MSLFENRVSSATVQAIPPVHRRGYNARRRLFLVSALRCLLFLFLSHPILVHLVAVDGDVGRQFAVRVEVVPLAVDLYPLAGSPVAVLVKPILAALCGGQPAGFNCVVRLNVLPLAFAVLRSAFCATRCIFREPAQDG